MPQSETGTVDFSGWRAFFWPVHHHELRKLIPMLLIFFLIFLDYNVLRTLKDAVVVTAEASGAEVIPFIKVWMMFPGAILLTFIFTRLSNRFSRETVFYVLITSFLVYFCLFTFVLYPAHDYLHPHAFANKLELMLPPGFKGFIAMIRNWTFSTFYVMSELWSNIILSLLFWGFANQVTKIHEAKRFYGLFGIGANFSGVAAGLLSSYLSDHIYNPNFPLGHDAWEQSLIMLVGLIVATALLAMGIFRWMHKNILTDSECCNSVSEEKADSKAPRLSVRDSITFLMRSKYLISIAIIVVAYNLVINLVEVVWKHEVYALYPNPNDYNWYMNQVTTFTGILATVAALILSGNSVRKFGWTFTAMLTPTILLVTSIGFFGFFFTKPFLADATTPLVIAVFFGSAQNILSRAAKYTVFDATKEMAFVPLSKESQLKGKAVVDGVCSRLGKSGGSVIHQTLLICFSSITASAPYVAGFLLLTILVWISATRILGRQFSELTTTPHRKQETPSPGILPSGLTEQQAI